MNNWSITGNLGNDCRKNTVGGSAVVNFSVAVKSGFGDKAQTIWVDCALWGKQAESKLPEYLLKGTQVAVSGEMGTREHEGKTYITLRVASIDLLGGKQEGGNARNASAPEPAKQQAPSDNLDDDIPF